MAYPPAAKELPRENHENPLHNQENGATTPSSKETDFLDPLEWNMHNDFHGAAEIALLNEVELSQEYPVMMEGSLIKARRDEEEDNANENEAFHHKNKFLGRKRAFPQDFHEEESESDHKKQRTMEGQGAHPPITRCGGGFKTFPEDVKPSPSHRRKKKTQSLPKRPLDAYGIFCQEEMQKQQGLVAVDDIQRRLGKTWRSLPPEELTKYEKLAETEKQRFQHEMEAYTKGQDKPSHGSATNVNNHPRSSYEPSASHFIEDIVTEQSGPPTTKEAALSPGPSPRLARSAYALPRRADPMNSSFAPPARWGYGPPHYLPAPGNPVNRATRVVSDGSHAPGCHHADHPQHGQRDTHPQYWNEGPPRYPPAVSPSRSFSPHFGRPARPAYAPDHQRRPQLPPSCFAIPRGMELSLPSPVNGSEQRYRVNYHCYAMKREDVDAFMASLQPTCCPPRW